MSIVHKVRCPVTTVTAYGQGVYEVTFAAGARYTKFRPGQFLHLALDEFDPTSGFWPESRVFSIASEPRQESVSIVYSVKGDFTQRMEKELVPGRQVWLKLPYGSFVIDEGRSASEPFVLIAGGTGVSPYIPFLSAERQRDNVVHVFYGVRKPEHLLFSKLWQRLSTQSWLRLHLMVEDGSLDGLAAGQGPLSIDLVANAVGAPFLKCQFFLSGPPGMIQRFKSELSSRGVPVPQIYIDEWE